jgi:hypothetical protein
MANEITPEIIDGFFEQYGWSYSRDEGGRDWSTGFRGDVSSFRILVRLTDNWIYFTIIPFIVATKNEACRQRLYWHILRLNRDITLAKFGLDEDNDVLLTVELPIESLDYSEFADALNAICYYADDTYLEMLNLSQRPDAPSRYEAQQEENEGLDWGEGNSGE